MSVSSYSGIDSLALYVNDAVTSSRLDLDRRLRHMPSKYLISAPTPPLAMDGRVGKGQ